MAKLDLLFSGAIGILSPREAAAMTTKKYELTDTTMTYYEVDGVRKTVYAIRALRDIPLAGHPGLLAAEQGDLGGYVESEDNLSHDGCAWVGENGIARGNARITDNAFVGSPSAAWALAEDSAAVSGNALVWDHVSGNACVSESAWIADGHVTGDAEIRGTVEIHDGSTISTGVLGTHDAPADDEGDWLAASQEAAAAVAVKNAQQAKVQPTCTGTVGSNQRPCIWPLGHGGACHSK